MADEDAILTALDEFAVEHISSILTGRRSNTGVSATLKFASDQSQDLVAHPTWYAVSKAIKKQLERDEHEGLLALGAAPEGGVQIINVRDPEAAPSKFSVQCALCHLWINTGNDEPEGECICGAAYRVVFENTPMWTPSQARVRRFPRCAGCGQELGMRERLPEGPRRSQIPLNDQLTQEACELCETGNPRIREFLRGR